MLRSITFKKRRMAVIVTTCLASIGLLPNAGIARAAAPLTGAIVAPSSNVLVAKTIKGKVSSVDGTPLPGVSVIVKGTTTGTSTNESGEYTISVPGDNSVLVFSYIGYISAESAVGSRSVVNISLTENVEVLDEAVVTALGIKKNEKALGYSVGKVKGADLATVGNESVLTSLAGRVSGVTINQTSGTGSSINVVIRGATSLKNNQPLFVVDGVPMANSISNVSEKGSNNKVDYGNAISDINPDDIESMTVLKGASAAALYGSRAGHGVILITTKSGKKGKGLGVSFNTSNVWEKPYRYLDFHYKYANGSRPSAFSETSAYWGGPELDKGNKAVQWNSPVDANGNKVATELRSYKDNMKNFVETGFTTNNNLSVSGATETATYRISYNNMSNKGLVPGQDLYRNGVSLATTFDLNKAFTLTSNLNFTKSNSNSRPVTSERNANPLQAVYNWSHVDVRELAGIWRPGMEQIQQLTPAAGYDNPYFLALGMQNGFNRDRIYGNIKLDWNITPDLKAFARISNDRFTENRQTKIPWSYASIAKGGYYYEDIWRSEVNTDFLLTYSKKIADFDVSLSGGGSYMNQRFRGSSNGGNQLSVPGLFTIANLPIANRTAAASSQSEKGIYSLYAMGTFGFKDQLFLDLTARNDWSSTLPASNRSFFYPSASLSWLAHSTFRLPSEVSMLKLRGNWAQVGSDTDPYQLYAALGTESWGDLISTTTSATLLNPNLKPEIATSIEGGIDMALFNNRLRFDLTYYNVVNKNQILSISSTASSGYTSQNINAGQLRSKGWEIGIGGTPIQNKNGWTVDLNVNFTRNRVILEELTEGQTFFELYSENGGGAYTYVGEEMGNLYSRGFATVTDKNSQYYRWPIIAWNGTSGDQDWQALSGRENNVKVGNFNPRFVMGGQANISYKRFGLGMSFDWRNGGEFMSYTYRYGESDWKSQRQIDQLIPGGNYTPDQLVALLKSDPEKYIIPQNGNYPRVGGHTAATGGLGPDGDGAFIPGVWQDAQGNYHEWLGGAGTQYTPITDMYPWSYNQQVTFDASFVKLREITLSYRLPNFFKGAVKNASFAVFARNIMLWNAAKIGIDPERAFWADAGSKTGGFRQGIERQNVTPWTIPVGFKLNFDF